MTSFPAYTLDHVRAALNLTDEQAEKVRDYVPPPPVPPELRLARDLIADAVEFGMTTEFTSSLVSDFRNGCVDWGHLIQRAIALQRRHELDTPAQPQADDDGWIPWHGGDCPVDPTAFMHVRYRDGEEGSGSQYWWDHSDRPRDIIAYKPEPGK